MSEACWDAAGSRPTPGVPGDLLRDISLGPARTTRKAEPPGVSQVPFRNTIARILLVVYAIGSVALAIPLLLDMTGDVSLAETTSGRILAAALLAMGLGAALAVRDPWGKRAVIQVLIAFTALASLAIAYRMRAHRIALGEGRTSLVLASAIAAAVLFAVFYPTRPRD
jgi:hypothetical protein